MVFEFIFCLDMLTKFLLEYTDDFNNHVIRDLSMISLRYLKSGFIFDIVPLLPIN